MSHHVPNVTSPSWPTVPIVVRFITVKLRTFQTLARASGRCHQSSSSLSRALITWPVAASEKKIIVIPPPDETRGREQSNMLVLLSIYST